MRYEYTAIAAPARGEKAKEAKTPTDRYALGFTAELNRMAADGWEYIRADVLPSEERTGLTGRTTVYHNLLVFRRPLSHVSAAPRPEYPAAAAPAPEPRPQPQLPEAAAPQRPIQPETPEVPANEPTRD
ncbi:DUF4177 domain-containing protein [Paracoccus homiensis]|uniref:DUF4177 domain-containing protein n=1 Tax=Paracoccus homiensis TaxID=364199 RepID=A0A1H9Y7P7_9RHOB|nr:DUF4177 domain-containing protein [Paracoccus homiensis]SES64835.1 hypothetical protein SAMN04489858_10163 [Paracoccus homiensis]